jgi:hypothetical protein
MTQGMDARFAGNAGKNAEMLCKKGGNYAIMPINPTPTIPIRTIAVFPLLFTAYGFAPFSRLACFASVSPISWRISWRYGPGNVVGSDR